MASFISSGKIQVKQNDKTVAKTILRGGDGLNLGKFGSREKVDSMLEITFKEKVK